jgi:4-methyl-5(b-hydroxyethyl)-thiazole monophosphate biosynthesis
MKKTVLVPIADGSEEIEAVTIIDVLRRAGAEVIVAAPGGLQVTASRGVRLTADMTLAECAGRTFDCIAIPGGMPGAAHLHDSDVLTDLLKRQAEGGRLYAAICAAPAVVLKAHGLLEGRRATCHPAFHRELEGHGGVGERVVVDGQCVTSGGPGTAMEFALKLVEVLFGLQTARDVAGPMLARSS